MRLRTRVLAAMAAVVLVGCGGGGSDSSDTTGTTSGDEETTTTTAVEETTTTASEETTTTVGLPAGAEPGLDDYDGDGEPDPTCGTQDFGGGLVLRVPCEIETFSEVPQNVTLVPDSLFRFPSNTGDYEIEGAGSDLILARDDAGTATFVFINNSDSLFETGSAALGSPDNLDAVVRIVGQYWAGGRVQVRGHTDSTGSASANQALSEQRAQTVADYLGAAGIDAVEVVPVGLASTQPLAVESTEEGMRFNRRVEIVVRY